MKFFAKIFAIFFILSLAPAFARDKIDFDLTKTNPTFLYVQVLNMLKEPKPYNGKTVRIRGAFEVHENEERRTYNCVVQDATACCSQGLPFEMAENLNYPDDFPERGKMITVTGKFRIFKEKGYSRIALVNAKFE